MAYISQERKAQIAPVVKAICKKYGIKATLSVRNHSSLVLTVKQGNIDFGGNHVQVNPYWYHEHYTGQSLAFLSEVIPALKGADWYDRSDISTDYFDTAYYYDVNIGSWDKPYKLTP